ncbi:hypothetical protein [Parabacteroides sp. AF17-28]|uniref:hypothetical protein n=1 Tax=Parabacteroides sp. AF17-28 TaxID=2292241 RepID=UPI001314DD03|nr:hypothetical protein [Parabacteroides sp. AF17-28]
MAAEYATWCLLVTQALETYLKVKEQVRQTVDFDLKPDTITSVERNKVYPE